MVKNLVVAISALWLVFASTPAKAQTTAPATQPSSQPVADGPQAMLNELETIAGKLAPLLQKDAEEFARENGKIHEEAVREIRWTVKSVDVKKTDSLIDPIIGEIILDESDSTNIPAKLSMHSFNRYTFHLSKRDGRWRLLRAVENCISDSYVKDRAGKTTELSKGWC